MSDIERISTASWRNVPRLETRSFRNNRRTIGGYGAVFGVPSDPRLGFREIVERSCFNKSAGDGWPGVIALFEHQPGIVLGAVHSGTMRLKQDSYGLDYEVDLPETRSAEYESIKRGDVHSSSVGFQVYQDEWRPGDGGLPTRYLVSARLHHIAPTSSPAYPDATVALRHLAMQAEADFDEVYRDAQARNLNRYLVRTDNRDIAPTPELIARSHASSVTPADLKRRADANRDRGVEINRADRIELNRRIEANSQREATLALEARLDAHRHRELAGSVETRSGSDDFPRDRYDNAIYWHPWRQ